MNRLIREDLYRYVPKGYSLRGLLKGLRSPGFKYMFLLRLSASTDSSAIRFFLRLLLRRYVFKYGFQIPYNTRIGGGLYISHFGAIAINPDVVIGRNCNITHGVTIGQTNRGKLKGCPTLGDHVWVGANAVIVGNIRIGDNVLIAPAAFVNFDVPSQSIVIGNPGKIIPATDATADYICNVLAT